MNQYLRNRGRALGVVVGLSGAALCGDAFPAGANPIIQTIAEQAPSDEQVTYRVEARLRTDGRIDWELLDVEVQQGAVTLYGEVLTEDQKGLASVIASTVPGVTRLINRILVDQALSGDSRLRKAVWRTLRGVEALQDQTQTLRVSVKQAVVTLSGSVEQPLQKLAAEKAAESVQGMPHVINAITVQRSPVLTERETLRRQGREELP